MSFIHSWLHHTYDESIYSGRYRYLLLVLAEIQMLLITGIVFGWSPLEQEMEKQGVFQYLCNNNETTCNEQSLRLNLVYTLGAFTATGSAFLSGALFDKHGPIWTSLTAMIIMIAGCICWYISHLVNDNLYILAFALLGIGGPACQVSLIHIQNLFPSYYSSISTSFSGMFVGSSFVFKVFSIIAQKYDISIAKLFLFYIIILVVLFVPGLFMMHHKPYLPFDEFKASLLNKKNHHGELVSDEKESLIVNKSDNHHNHHDHHHRGQDHQEEESLSSSTQALLTSSIPIDNDNNNNNTTTSTTGSSNHDFKQRSLMGQLLSWQFILICLFMSINSLHSVFYIGIVNDLFNGDSLYIDIFNYSWNGGLILVPLVAVIMLKSSLAMNAFYVNVCGVLFGVFSSIPAPQQLQYATFFFVSLQNVYIWGYFFIYLSEIFGYNHYGKLMGISSIITALIGLLEYLLVYLTLNVMKYFWINIILSVIKILLFIFPYKLWRYQNEQQKLQQHQKNQQHHLMGDELHKEA